MKIKSVLLAACVAMSTMSAMGQSLSPSTKWHWNEGTIVVDTPQRQNGQKSVFQLALPKIANVRVGFVGLGMRGPSAVNRWTEIPGTQVVALCDYEAERAEECQKYLREKGLPPAYTYSGEDGYKSVCERPDIDIVYIAADWDHHFPIAKYALENNKNVAIEVPSAMNLEQCWALINLAEEKQLHCMILENCCYDWYEMTALNMAQKGVFGEVIRGAGAYIHDLEPYWEEYWKNPADKEQLGWRLYYNRHSRGDVYATHGMGPVAQAMNIHRGDRIKTLVSMDTKSVIGKQLVEAKTGKKCESFRNGDQTTTLMRTEGGYVIEIEHNTMTPQPYNRIHTLTGTKGYATKYPVEHYALTKEQLAAAGVNTDAKVTYHQFLPEAEHKALEDKYRHPILVKYGEKAKEVGGHGGMDFIMDSRLVYCLQNGLPLDMDVYDLAEWCCIAELGSLSMDHNCAAVEFPDFTRGHCYDAKGYTHAFASEADEAATDARAKAITEVQKKVTAKNKLWTLYDAAQKGNAKAQAAYSKALAKAYKSIK